MVDVLAENLAEKDVMGDDGTKIGSMDNITMNLKTGTLRKIIVAPADETAPVAGLDRDEDGRYHIPATRVKANEDYILIER